MRLLFTALACLVSVSVFAQEPETAYVFFYVDMTGSEYPNADYDFVVVNGSWNAWNGWGVTLADGDGDGIFTGGLEIVAGTSFEYVVAVTGAADSWSGWGVQFSDGCTYSNASVTAGEAGSVTDSYFTVGCSEVLGCMDMNASNYNPDATEDDGSCEYPDGPGTCNNQTSVTYQGYEYDIVEIGLQCWFAENLRNTNYNNGDEIPGQLNDDEWIATSEGAQSIYGEGSSQIEEGTEDNEFHNLEDYGRLYNWYAISDSRGLCPDGWHIPSDQEWIELEVFLGMSMTIANSIGWRGTDEGKKLKSSPLNTPSWNGTNDSGFSGLAGGRRNHYNGGFSSEGIYGSYWTSTPDINVNGNPDAWARDLSESDQILRKLNNGAYQIGYSARCVTNQLVVEVGLDYDGNGDGCVDVNDMLDLLLEYGQCEPESQLDFDGNGDGCVNGEDVLNILVEYGSCE